MKTNITLEQWISENDGHTDRDRILERGCEISDHRLGELCRERFRIEQEIEDILEKEGFEWG
jgi:hypothetical protein